MNIEKLKEIAFSQMAKRTTHTWREPGYIYYHGLRTAKISLNLRKLIFPADTHMDDIIFAGALFHDIGKGIGSHNETGSLIIRHILRNEIVEKDLDYVTKIIENHCLRDESVDHPFWIKLVQDADILDKMGSTQVWTNIVANIYLNKNIDEACKFFNDNSFDNFYTGLNYQQSIEIMKDKINYVKSFSARFQLELDGEFPLAPAIAPS